MNNIIDGTTVAAEHSLTPTAARTYATDMLRALIVGIVTIGVALFGLPAGTASAEPPLAAQGTSPARIRFDASVSASQYAALKIARDVINKDTRGRTLDYKKARKRFGKHSTYRRELAAAWLTSGGRIKNISKAESKRVRKYRPKSNKTAAKGLASAGTGTNCTGDTTYFTFGPGAPNYYFYDSCDTEDIKTGATLCMTGAGLTAAILKHMGVAAAMSILIAGCAVTGALVSNAQAKSKKHAIIILTKSFYVAKGNRYVAPVELRSQ